MMLSLLFVYLFFLLYFSFFDLVTLHRREVAQGHILAFARTGVSHVCHVSLSFCNQGIQHTHTHTYFHGDLIH